MASVAPLYDSQMLLDCFSVCVKEKIQNVGITIKNSAIATSQAIADAFYAIVKAFSESESLSKICKLTTHVLSVIGHVIGSTFRGASLLKIFTAVEGLFDVTSLINDANDIVNGNEKNKIEHAATVGFLIADIGGFFLWLDDLAIISLSNISATIGQGLSKITGLLGSSFSKFSASIGSTFPMLAKLIGKISLLTIVRSLVTGAFVFLAINEGSKLWGLINAEEKDVREIVKSGLNLASYIGEIALSIIVFAGCTNVIALSVLGGIAVGLGLAAILCETFHEIRKKRIVNEAQQQPLAAAV